MKLTIFYYSVQWVDRQYTNLPNKDEIYGKNRTKIKSAENMDMSSAPFDV